MRARMIAGLLLGSLSPWPVCVASGESQAEVGLSAVYQVVSKQRELPSKGFDCKYMNSPPCECSRPEADAIWAAATPRDLPLPPAAQTTMTSSSSSSSSSSYSSSSSNSALCPNKEFPSYHKPAPAEATTCGAFALELAGGYGGERGLAQMAEKLVGPSGGSVDVFAHLFAHATPPATASSAPALEAAQMASGRGGRRGGRPSRAADEALAAAFGARLRDVTFEAWDPDLIGAHIRAVANNRTGALEWLESSLARRYSRIFCGNLGVPTGSPEQKCRRTWPQVLIHSLSMWRKIYLASAMRRRFEAAHACRYELVVRTRPDYVMLQEVDLRHFRGGAAAAPRLVDVATLNSQQPLGLHTAHTFCGGFQRPHKTTEWCEWRAENWPEKACFADDQFAVGDGQAMEAYARLFPDFDRWAWWYPLNRRDGFRHLSERLLLTHLDWRQRASLLHARAGSELSNTNDEAFRWDSKMPNGSAAHIHHRLDRSQDHRLRGH